MKNYYLSIAPIIEEAGIKLRKGFGKTEAIAFKSDAHASAVTELDRSTEQFLAERLHKLYPEIEFFGEESGGNDKASQFWLVDPIDGTGNFIRGLPFCTTMIALIQEGQPVFSVIYNFMTKEIYSAEKGKGATLNGFT
jgi:myo-inositol-1(or 4)-monophosphatase